MNDTAPSSRAKTLATLCAATAAAFALYALSLFVVGSAATAAANEAFWKFQADSALRGDLVEMRRIAFRPFWAGVELRFCDAEFTPATPGSYRLRVPGCIRLRLPFVGKTVAAYGPNEGRYVFDGDFSGGVAKIKPFNAVFRYDDGVWIGRRAKNIAKNWSLGLRSINFSVAEGNFFTEEGGERKAVISFDGARFGWVKNAAESERGRYRAEIRNVRYEESELPPALRELFPLSANVFFRLEDEGASIPTNRFHLDELELRFDAFDVSAEGYVDPPSDLDIFPSASMRFFVENFDGMLDSRAPLWFLRLPAENENARTTSQLRAFFSALGQVNDRQVPPSAEFSVERLPGGKVRIGDRNIREISDMYERLKRECLSPL